ncbi:MAG: hypothetical protein ACRCUT_03420 [Spirochaetota bacterium]
MKKYFVLAVCAFAAAGFISCAKETPLGAAQKIYSDIIENAETAAEKLGKAATGKEAGDALVEYAEKMQKLTKRSQELQEKYPDFDERTVPEMKESQEKMETTMKNFADTMRKTMVKFAGDKDFISSAMKMSAIMSQQR